MVKRAIAVQATEHEMEIRQLRAFVTLVELGRVTYAARALTLAQSSVSEALAALERRLGAQLLLRRSGSAEAPVLTTAGRAFLPHARKVLAAVDEARRAVDRTVNHARARVIVVATESISTYWLPHALASLRKKWLDTRFVVRVARPTDVRDSVAASACDLGLLLERADGCSKPARIPPARGAIRGRVVDDDVRLIAFALVPHSLQGRPVVRESMAPYPLFVSEAAFDFREFMQRYTSKRSAVRLRVESAGSVEGVKKAVLCEAEALGLLPAFTVTEEIRQGIFAGLDLRPPPPRMRLRALLPRGSRRTLRSAIYST